MSRVLFVLALGVPACVQVSPIEVAEEDCIPTAVQAAFDGTCAIGGCHDAAGANAGLVLSAPASAEVLGRTASQRPMPLVTIGSLEDSYVAQKLMLDPTVEIVGSTMPVGLDASNAARVEDVAIILGWIAGAVLPGCEVGESSGGETTGDATTGGETTGGESDLPCEIEELLALRCRSCHADPPTTAPMPLVTLDDLLAPSLSDPTLTVAERAAARMVDPMTPMPPPPTPSVTADELAAFNAWIAAGMPAGSCGGEPNPFDVEPRCTSERFWTMEEEDPRMHPGRNCIGCHDSERAEDPTDGEIPDLVVAGTVYPTGHEPDECWGDASGDLRVVIRSLTTDDEVMLTPGASGNFFLRRTEAPPEFAPPFAIRLVQGDNQRIMAMPAPNGRCNGCHTQDGAMGAPGRIVAP